MIRTALLMVGKDLRLFVRDKVALMLAVLLPLVLVTVFGTIMSGMGGGGGGGGMPAVDLALLDLDDSATSRAMVAALADMDGIDLDVRAPTGDADADRAALRELVHDGDVPFAAVLPPGFGEGAELRLLRDPGRDLSQQLLMIGLVRALFEVRGEDMAWELQNRALAEAGIPEEWMARVEAFTIPFRAAMESLFDDADAAGLLADADADGSAADDDEDADTGPDFQDIMMAVLPVEAEDVLPEGRQSNITYMVSHAVSGMTVMMLMFSLVGFARSLLEERDDGTLRRLLCAPIDVRAILLSKALGSWVVGLGLTLILFVYASMLFDLDVASRWDTLLVISAVTAASTTGFALLIAAVATSDKQADGLSTILILVMSALGGAWMPLLFMPEVVQTAARFTLPFWSIDAYQSTFWNGLHWTDPAVLRNLGVLLAVAAALFVVASRLFRRRYTGAPAR